MLENFLDWGKVAALAGLLLEWEGQTLYLTDEAKDLLRALNGIGSKKAVYLARVMRDTE